MWLVWNHIFILYYGHTPTSETQYKTQNNYFSVDFCKMTKYFVMRECENITTWISLCLTTVFSQQGRISVFKFPKRFLEFSWAKISLYSFFITLLTLIIKRTDCRPFGSQTLAFARLNALQA
jgi:hypothetical protein